MTLHFHRLHAPRWMAHAHFNRAVMLVLSVIVVSLLFSALRVVDAAVSGALIERHATAANPAASVPAELLIGNDPTGAGAKSVDTSVVDVPEAAVEAVSL
jgi:hypothetical protein